MRSRWSDEEADLARERHAPAHGEAVALRVYTSRLIGGDPALVLHGGGNTSVKAPYTTLLGDRIEAIFVKGSGWNLDTLEPAGLPGLDLAHLRRLEALEQLSDEEMVNQLRTHLFDASAPNPSVETLLHAFLPHRFVDHSHADAILALTNQPDGEAWAKEALGPEVLSLPYIMPGFPLARAVAQAYREQPECIGIVLQKHGLFSFADDAKTSYERHIELVDRAERFLAERTRGRKLFTPSEGSRATPSLGPASPELAARVGLVAPMLRGLLAEPAEDPFDASMRFVLDWRRDETTLAFCGSREAARLCDEGPLTPDHVIRTKSLPLLLETPSFGDEARLREQLASAVGAYRERYERYFDEQVAAKGIARTRLDSAPRVVLIPGVGALCFGRSKADARIVGDITEHTLATKGLAEAAGRYSALDPSDLFDMEYWSLEQAKLGKSEPRPLEGRIVLVTGGAGAIGVGIGDACLAAGAHVVLADLDGARARAAAEDLARRGRPGCALGLEMDVCDEGSVQATFEAVCCELGGVDVVVPNAGVALVSPIESLSYAEVRRVADVNYVGVLGTIREAARVFRRQGIGGHIVINASKNVFAPGAEFGAYSASKAAAAQIGKVAALELADIGVRVNLVNADAVFSEGDVASGLWQQVGPERARSRGLAPEDLPEFYRQRNLLKTRVRGRHVGNAVVFFASNLTPTTGATLPVDGGVAAAFPR